MAEKKVDFYMPFYIGDYLADTNHLSCEEHGAYLLLLFASWRRGGRLPNDPGQLARIAACPARRWRNIWGIIAHFFREEGGALVQTRVTRELQKAQRTQNGSVRGGLASAERRRLTRGSAEPEKRLSARKDVGGTRTPLAFASARLLEAIPNQPEPEPEPDLVRGRRASETSKRRPAKPERTARWSAYDWLRRYGVRWSAVKGKLSYGRGGDRDSAAARDLEEQVAALPPAEQLTVQGQAEQLFDLYLADTGSAAQGGHPFTWFVDRFNGYRARLAGVTGAARSSAAAAGYAAHTADKDWNAGMDKIGGAG